MPVVLESIVVVAGMPAVLDVVAVVDPSRRSSVGLRHQLGLPVVFESIAVAAGMPSVLDVVAAVDPSRCSSFGLPPLGLRQARSRKEFSTLGACF